MDTGILRNKLTSIKQNIGTKHHKVTCAALCDLIHGLIVVIEEIQHPPVTILSQQLSSPNIIPESPHSISKEIDDIIKRKKKGDAGDLKCNNGDQE